jgi:hypothetical protein
MANPQRGHGLGSVPGISGIGVFAVSGVTPVHRLDAHWPRASFARSAALAWSLSRLVTACTISLLISAPLAS